MRIAIIENVWYEVEYSFQLANMYYFNNKLKFEQFTSSQELGDLKDLDRFDLMIVDISLSSRSDQDGFHLIKRILATYPRMPIIILTGNSMVREAMQKFNIPDEIPIIFKPVDAEDIRKTITPYMKKVA